MGILIIPWLEDLILQPRCRLKLVEIKLGRWGHLSSYLHRKGILKVRLQVISILGSGVIADGQPRIICQMAFWVAVAAFVLVEPILALRCQLPFLDFVL